MDYRTGVEANPGTASPDGEVVVLAEQAIFTSLRSPMGEGYRLVAMSPGITAEERAEITRRCPSHGSIAAVDPGASAMAGFLLGTQRYCVGWTRYAGREHTARGGLRVHTHLVVLEGSAFRAFHFDPFQVLDALRTAVGPEPNIRPRTCLEPLALSAGCYGFPFEKPDLSSACTVAGQLALGDPVILGGAARPVELLQLAVGILPLAFRPSLSVSANLHYAPSRQVRAFCVGEATPEMRRAIAGQPVRWVDLGRDEMVAGHPGLQEWLKLVAERGEQERLPEILGLACQLSDPADAATLTAICTVCRDLDRVARADQNSLEAMVSRYASLRPSHPLEGRLVRSLLSSAVHQAGAAQRARTPAPLPAAASCAGSEAGQPVTGIA